MLVDIKPLTTIKRALKEAPFKPFHVLLDNGSKIPISHPDCMIPSADICMVLDSRGIPWTVDTWHVSGISFDLPQRRARRGK